MARSVTEIQADLDAAIASRRAALKAQEYSMDTGQGRQSVKRVDLTALNKLIKDLESEINGASDAASGFTGVDFLSLQRHGL